jgi:hypothetical protein
MFILDSSFSLSVSLQATTTLASFILLVVALIIYSKPYTPYFYLGALSGFATLGISLSLSVKLLGKKENC